MKVKRAFLIMLAVGLSVGVLSGQPAAVEARRVLQNSVQAHGGAAALAALGDTRATGRQLSYNGATVEQSTLDIRTRTDEQVWIQRSFSGGTRLYVSDGRAGWVTENGQRRAVFSADSANRPMELNPVVSFLVSLVRGRLEPLSVEAIEGQVGDQWGAFYVVDVRHKRRGPQASDPFDRERDYQLIVDADTYLVKALRIPLRSSDGRLLEDTEDLVYSDHQSREDVVVPLRVERFLYGSRQMEILLDDFRRTQHGDIFVEP